MRALPALLLVAACARSTPAPPAAPDPILAAVDSIARAFMQEQGAPGLAIGILRPGQPDLERGYGVTWVGGDTAVTPKTLFHMASVTKPFVATGIVQLVEAGKIDLDAPVTRYLPYFQIKGKGAAGITIRQLLTHTAGMPDVTDYRWDHPEYDAGALERYVRGLKDSTLIAAPGEKWEYSNIGFEVLADVIAKVSGQEFEVYEREHILAPLGMTHSTLLMTDVDSARLAWGHGKSDSGAVERSSAYPYNRRHAASSTLHSDVIDMLRWARANLQHGELDGHRILQATSYDQLWKPERDMMAEIRARAAQAHIELPYDSFQEALSWFVLGWKGHRLINHSGGDRGFRSDLFLAPDDSVAVVVMANQERADVGALARRLLEVVYSREGLKRGSME